MKEFFIKLFRYFFPKKMEEIIHNEPEVTCGVRIADPEEQELIEERIIVSARTRGKRAAIDRYVIPVHVHIIHKGEDVGSGTNISDKQIYSAINALNEDYSKEIDSRGDGLGAASPFRFALSNKDDDGQPTNGISRVNGAAKSAQYALNGIRSGGYVGEVETTVKNWSRRNSQRVYNIWVVTEIDGNNGGSGIQGYAYFPTTSIVDGTVVLFNAFGTTGHLKSYTNLNKTITHELGHAFGLFHTFQGNSCTETNCALQGDRVCDTPPTTMNSNGNNPACGGTQQVRNYMDYTGQAFKNMFTPGQVERMNLVFEASRKYFITSDALDNLSTLNAEATLEMVTPNIMQIANTRSPIRVKVTNTSDVVIHNVQFEYTVAGITKSMLWYGPIEPNSSDTITLAKVNISETTDVEVKIKEINSNTKDIVVTRRVSIPTSLPYKVSSSSDVLEAQVSWNVAQAISGIVVYSNPLIPNFKPNIFSNTYMGLDDGDYIFTITDVVPGLQTPGAYTRLFDGEGNILVNAEGTFSTITHAFTVGKKEEEPEPDPEFKFLRSEVLCEETQEGPIIIFYVENDKLVQEYSIVKIGDGIKTEVAKVKPNNLNGEIGYKVILRDYDNPSQYELRAILEGRPVSLDEMRIECGTKVHNNVFEIRDGIFSVDSVKFINPALYDEKGNEYKIGSKLNDEDYYLVFGENRQFKISLRKINTKK